MLSDNCKTAISGYLILHMQMRRKFLFILIFTLTPIACSNQQNPNAYQLSGSTMGTTYNITIVGENLVNHELINSALEDIESAMSTYRLESELMQLNEAPINTWINVSPALYEVLLISEEISVLSNGAFDITVSPLVNLWGFGPEKHENDTLPNTEDIEELLRNIGFEYLIIAEDREAVLKREMIRLDLSAVAKGYAVDVLAELLEENNISNYLVEIGGEISGRGRNAEGNLWQIAIEAPLRSAQNREPFQIIGISGLSLASSGDYRNFFEVDDIHYSHTIDPSSGSPINHNLASVTVIAETTAIADALATAFNVMGIEQAMALANNNNIAVYFIIKTADGFLESYSMAFAQYINENYND
jgi:FAD:protein FMN transferase